jgi:hypothetical protein
MNDVEYFKENIAALIQIFGGGLALTFIGGQLIDTHTNERGGFTVQWKSRSANGANRMTMTLTGMDLIKIEFGRFRAGKYTVIKTINELYAEDFASIWWSETGLARSFRG